MVSRSLLIILFHFVRACVHEYVCVLIDVPRPSKCSIINTWFITELQPSPVHFLVKLPLNLILGVRKQMQLFSN